MNLDKIYIFCKIYVYKWDFRSKMFTSSSRHWDVADRQIHELLKNSWPDQCISVQRIRKVMTEFEDGTRVGFGRQDGSGRPKSDVRKENVAKVNNIINEDSCLTDLDLSHTMVHNIMRKELELTWHHTKWVPSTRQSCWAFMKSYF